MTGSGLVRWRTAHLRGSVAGLFGHELRAHCAQFATDRLAHAVLLKRRDLGKGLEGEGGGDSHASEHGGRVVEGDEEHVWRLERELKRRLDGAGVRKGRQRMQEGQVCSWQRKRTLISKGLTGGTLALGYVL